MNQKKYLIIGLYCFTIQDDYKKAMTFTVSTKNGRKNKRALQVLKNA
jgi:hypothetical protein